MLSIFTRYSALTGQSFFKGPLHEAGDAVIVQNAHSRGALPDDAMGIHLFRDPLALLLSHVRYHETTESPTEPPNAKRLADGRLYGEHLREQPTLADKARFEIDHVCGNTLRSMLAWDYDNPRFLNYPLDVFTKADSAERAARQMAATFAIFTGHEEALVEAVLGQVGGADRRQRHRTRVAGEQPADVLSAPVLALLHRRFPGLPALTARLAAWQRTAA